MFNRYFGKKINWGDKLSVFHYICLFLLLVSFTLPFIAGMNTKDARQEELSNYIAERIKDSTRNKEILGVSISSTPVSGAIPASDDEFHRLYGIFKQTNATFMSGFNINKNHSISFSTIEGFGNLSIVYTGADISQKYNGHYKHGTYPFELMFETPRLYDISSYMIYLSQSQADAFLAKNNVNKTNNVYTQDDYYSLIRQTFDMSVDGKEFKCVICNVFYEFNYYYDDAKELLDNYVLCAYYSPGNLPRENIYFFREYGYENSYFINYINKSYPNKNYDLRLIDSNIVGKVDKQYVLSFYYDGLKTSNIIFIILITFSFLLASIVCLVNFLKCTKYNLKYYIIHILPFGVPYLLFFIIFKISKSALLFSNIGITMYVFVLIYYLAMNLLLLIIRRLFYLHISKRNRRCIR